MKFAFQIDLPSCQVTSFSLEHTLSFSPLIFSWKENKLSPNFFLPLRDPHNLFYNLFQCQSQIAAWSLASNRKSDQNADFLFKVFLLWSEIVRWLFDIQKRKRPHKCQSRRFLGATRLSLEHEKAFAAFFRKSQTKYFALDSMVLILKLIINLILSVIIVNNLNIHNVIYAIIVTETKKNYCFG